MACYPAGVHSTPPSRIAARRHSLSKSKVKARISLPIATGHVIDVGRSVGLHDRVGQGPGTVAYFWPRSATSYKFQFELGPLHCGGSVFVDQGDVWRASSAVISAVMFVAQGLDLH